MAWITGGATLPGGLHRFTFENGWQAKGSNPKTPVQGADTLTTRLRPLAFENMLFPGLKATFWLPL